ncbi:hypothetical protein [Paenibacillus polymyxa]|uniref:hypothetical protein n=1 Tax=Paenibacillus polymyxa TaxID=1406 RepID=UPI0032AF80A0
MSSKEELRRFFSEKQIRYESYSIEHNGKTHFIDTDTLIDTIINQASEEEQGVIKASLFQLDRRNLALNDYLRLLAEELIKNSDKKED